MFFAIAIVAITFLLVVVVVNYKNICGDGLLTVLALTLLFIVGGMLADAINPSDNKVKIACINAGGKIEFETIPPTDPRNGSRVEIKCNGSKGVKP